MDDKSKFATPIRRGATRVQRDAEATARRERDRRDNPRGGRTIHDEIRPVNLRLNLTLLEMQVRLGAWHVSSRYRG